MEEWFSILLHDRFGINFKITQDNNIRKIFIEGSSQCIRFNNLEPKFYIYGFNDNLKLFYWTADSENFNGIISNILPMPSSKEIGKLLSFDNNNNLNVSYDILGLCYWVLNRLEEVGENLTLDDYNRYDSRFSHACIHNYHDRPIVDEWLDILGQIILKTWPNLELKKNIYSLNLSHDVDRPSRFSFKRGLNLPKYLIGYLVKRRFKDFIGLTNEIFRLNSDDISIDDPFNTFEWLMNLSESKNIKSKFYFIAGGNHKYDAEYKITDSKIQKLIYKIYSRGHEIGLHPSYNCYKDPYAIGNELTALKSVLNNLNINQTSFGCRMHFLRWSHPETLINLESNGLIYDTTLGYPRNIGFRCGTCIDYRPIDPRTGVTLNLNIRPLHIMDCALVEDGPLDRASYESLISKASILISYCRKIGGSFNLLWHNSHLTHNDTQQIFEEILNISTN